jgi:hypothetical protein
MYKGKFTYATHFLTLLAIYLRLAHLFRVPSNAPFRLGGLFYEFSQQIIANGYALPKTIPFYSAGGIPFAYPPLGFYFQALIADLFSPPRFWTVNWLPPLVAALAVPSFYFLLRKLTDDQNLILGALLAYTMMPAAFVNQIEAAGLAEAFGTLTLIWYAYFLLGVEKGKWQQVLWAGLLLAAAVASSPGSAVGAVVFSLLFFGKMLLKGSKPILRFVLVGAVGFIASAPYWLTVIRNHSIGIFLTPMSGQFDHAQNGSFLATFFQSFFEFNYAGGDYALLWNALILAGLLWYLFQKERFLVSLFFAFALIPRESVWLTALVTPLFAGAGLAKIAIPLMRKGFQQISKRSTRLVFFAGIALITISVSAVNTLVAIEKLVNDEDWKISAAQIAELDQLREEIPGEAQIIVISNEAVIEWAPQILQREVINVKYGLEWEPNEFIEVLALNEALEDGENWETHLPKSGQIYILSDQENVLSLGARLIKVTETSNFRLEKISR